MENLTNSQKSIWVTEQYYKGSSVNTISGSAIIDEKLDFQKLEKSIRIVCQKHDNFKIKLKIKDGEIFQEFTNDKENIEFINLANEKEFEKFRIKTIKKTFDLESQLYKFYIIKFENGKGAFLLNIHHLISDAWTLALICNDIIKTYSKLINNQEIETKSIYSYIDYIKSEKEYHKSEKYKIDKNYWLEKYKTIPEVATIPGSKQNEANISSVIGERKQFKIEQEQVNKIKEYCKENKISLYNFFMAVYSIYIAEISNLDDFAIVTPILNRTNFKEKNTAGMFINVAPLRIKFSEDIEFKDFVKNIAIESIGMLKHQKYSYQSLIEELRKKDKNIPNLYNILISYQITKAQSKETDITYKSEWTFNGCCADDMDIQIYDLNDTGSLNIAYDYKVSIYEGSDIEKLHKRIEYIISQVLNKNDIEIKDIEIVTPKEKEKLVYEFNQTDLEYDKTKPIIKYFEEEAEKEPDKIALICNNKKITYGELNEKSTKLAFKLKEFDIKENDIVGIMINRSVEMVIGIFAILKADATYLPIDPEYPLERINYMIADSNAKVVLIDDKIKKDDFKNCLLVNVNEQINYECSGIIKTKVTNQDNRIVYLIYTSGSTGKPKGVRITNNNLNNFVFGMKQNIDFNKEKTMVSVTTICFDIFGLELWCSLTTGMTLVIANENEQNSPILLNKLCIENNVNMIQTTPSRFSIIFEELNNIDFMKKITEILVGGESLGKRLLTKIQENSDAKIYNMYGPTETTIWSTMKDVTHENIITIGKPIANTKCYILNRNQKLLPIGIKGELYIGGEGVSKGYLNREDLNNEKFIQSPFKNNERIYNTNDLAYIKDNGEIIHLGRDDSQIKIRGYRVELGEIEQIIEQSGFVSQVVVQKIKLKNNHSSLIAYYVANKQNKTGINEKIIKNYLLRKLPQYMIPQYFIQLKEMPYTPNGKIDRKALPELNEKNKNREITQPRNEIDKELIKMLKNMLNYEDISIYDTLLDLGGDSLTGITLSTKILSKYNVQINIKDILSNFTIKNMSDYILKNKNESKEIKIPRIEHREFYPLSSAQKRIYYNSKMISEENTVYNMPGAILIDGILDINKIQESLNKIVQRHEILRTEFVLNGTEIEQKVIENVDIKVPTFYNKSEEIEEIIEKFSKPFKLENEFLIRVEVHFIDNQKTLILVDSHHIIMDGTGLNNLIIEFNRIYNGDNLKKLPIQYRDYSVWEDNFLKSNKINEIESYWINKFKGCDFEQINLPYDYKTVANRSYYGDRVSNIIDEKEFKRIEKYAKKNGVSPYVFFLSAFFILLYKYTGQKDINLGSPIANRNINETKRMIGMFVNNIVVRGKINSDETFKEFLDNIKEQVLDDLSYQPYPFDLLVKKLGVQTDPSRNPLFDIMFTYQNKEERSIKINDKESKIIELNNHISKFNLSIEIKPEAHTINIEYSTELFKRQTIERLFEHYINLLNIIMNDVNTPIKDISIISEEEKEIIIKKFNKTKKNYPKNKTVITLFEEQVLKNKNKNALIFEDKKITYKELNEKANQLAEYLKELNIKQNDIIGIMLPRSTELIYSIIGVLKAGACYIPIDPEYPANRIKYMLEDSNAKCLITSRKLEEQIQFSNKIIIDESSFNLCKYSKNNLININNPNDLVYIIYTSGSTGKPKGVEIMHKNLYNFILGVKEKINFDENKNMLSVTTVCFDIFGLELWGALTSGQTLVITNEEEQNVPKLLNKLCIKNNVNIIQTTPARYSLILEDKENLDFFKNITDILIGGEPLTENILVELKEISKAKIYNMYGPTETTIWSTIKEVSRDRNITIGKPIANTQVYVLDRDLNILPIGIEGELYISGDGVGRGYHNEINKTNMNFIENPFIPNHIMYKTGDICKFNNSGELICYGRMDNQIKLRGLRIELEEIEKRIMEYPFISKVKVIKQIIGNREIISAYYISKRRIRVPELRTYLNKNLPSYMIPSYFTAIEKFPYTPNGKIDTKLLPIPDKMLESQKVKYEKPKTDLQNKIVEIWEEVLNIKPIGIKDNFFELGGDSILAMNLNIRLMKITDNISYSDIFSYPTIYELSKKIESEFKTNQQDFSNLNIKYKNILENNMKIPSKIEKYPVGNILLTGVTGFLGMHIMEQFLKEESGIIYVLVRKEVGLEVNEKFLNKLHYYFDNKYDKYLNDRIIIIQGDMTENGLGLKQEDLFKLGNSIDTIINSAAKVSHYGNYQEFYNINVKSVEKLLEFAKMFNKKLVQISTLSVSGNAFENRESYKNQIEEKIEFYENNFYINQDLENVYVRSKFEAEKKVLDAIENGVNAYILRIGNLMPRYKDGKFQENIIENAYLNRLKIFLKLKTIPDYLSNEYLEFTPVDKAAEAIIKVMQYSNDFNRIYHIFNDNYIELKNIFEIMKKNNIDIKIIENERFKKLIRDILNSKNADILSPIINELDKNLDLNYYSKIKINSDHSKKLLKKYSFEWPIIDKKYIDNILKLIKGE